MNIGKSSKDANGRPSFLPKSEGKFVKTGDVLRLSPRGFLRIGKVQKEHDEPLTEAQVKHRDRSYIISKLNKNIQQMQGEEKQKAIERAQYLDHYKKTANAEKKAKDPDFTEKAEKETAKRKSKSRRTATRKEEIPPSETYLQSATKENPIVIGDAIQAAALQNMQESGFQSFNMGARMLPKSLNQSISGTALNISRFDYELTANEQNILHQINPRQNIIQAR